MKAKGAKAVRRRGQSREDYATETIYWDAGTARLLPRLIGERTRGPLLVTHRKPGPGKVLTPRDVCPDTGLARLSYSQLRALLDRHTYGGGEEGTGWDPHECRHSGLTHLGEQGVSLLLFMAKSKTSPSAPPGSTSSPARPRSPRSPACSPPATAEPRRGGAMGCTACGIAAGR
ncbi:MULTISPECIES: hypothetical protein [Streptomyces]|uniref:hypothetical protein n=1 Tax=Streptomyces TaxID=1883 RepID=UPI001F2E03EF|nr:MULTISPECIES: hypothetical protein [Streptomyces]